MGPEKFKYLVASGRLYKIIGSGHYRPCGGVDFSNVPSISIVTDISTVLRGLEESEDETTR